MDMQLLKHLLSRLSKKAFAQYIFELWSSETYSTDKGFNKIKHLSDGTCELKVLNKKKCVNKKNMLKKGKNFGMNCLLRTKYQGGLSHVPTYRQYNTPIS